MHSSSCESFIHQTMVPAVDQSSMMDIGFSDGFEMDSIPVLIARGPTGEQDVLVISRL